MKSNNIPGATVAVTYKGRLIFNKGYGYANVERNIDMQPWHRGLHGERVESLYGWGVGRRLRRTWRVSCARPID